ncbi:hypothetical protein [Auraticoccus monumenti]|uniref:Uncharacterized protein n=1 Tax=Auraticoccus monumenti TaxID=675864 RepID=A0A1G7AR47_9ACTN|nr:hypothetical protein [Auraticoccus monumenti]SDE17348.1 hypothetical protein SAMN04489747_2705 [Auraticoccus monumenti]
MTSSADRQVDHAPTPEQDGRRGSQRWFTPEQEAENCARLLGHRRHGLDSLLPASATASSPSGPSTR